MFAIILKKLANLNNACRPGARGEWDAKTGGCFFRLCLSAIGSGGRFEPAAWSCVGVFRGGVLLISAYVAGVFFFFEVWLAALVLVKVVRSVLSVVPFVGPVFGRGGRVGLCLP